MTTIAYNHKDKEIACDSLRSSNGTIANINAIKFIETQGVLFVMAGCPSDRERFIDYYFGVEARNEFIPDCEAIVIDSGAVYLCGITDKHELWKEKLDCDCAIGSGGNFALAAMDFGKSACDAVEYAMTRDCYTGGKVHVFKVE